MLSLPSKPKELRSSGFHLSFVPRVTNHAGTRALSVAVPTLWNSLPEDVKTSDSIISSRHHFKTHLFRLAYIYYLFCTLYMVCSTIICSRNMNNVYKLKQ